MYQSSSSFKACKSFSCYWGWFVFWTDGSKKDVAIRLQKTSWSYEFFERKGKMLSRLINFLLNIIDDSSFSHYWKKIFQVETRKVLLSTISQERLNGLVIIFIERELVRNLNYENLVKKFI